MAERMTEQDILLQERQCTGTSKTKNEEFERNGYVVVKDLWDPEELYHPLPDMRGMIKYWDNNPEHFHHEEVEMQVEGSLARYWHPQYRKIHSGVRKKLEEVIGKKLHNTYYYDRFYFGGHALKKHADRPACEISVSIHISTNLPSPEKDWPFKIKTPDTYTDKEKTSILVPGEERSAVLNPGDGLLYKGCERPHWRDPLQVPRLRKRDKLLRRKPPEYYYHQIFFHYVLADGYRAQFAFDRGK